MQEGPEETPVAETKKTPREPMLSRKGGIRLSFLAQLDSIDAAVIKEAARKARSGGDIWKFLSKLLLRLLREWLDEQGATLRAELAEKELEAKRQELEEARQKAARLEAELGLS